MTDEELKILAEENGKSLTIDYQKEYSDEFYESYVANFEINNSRKGFKLYKFVKRCFDVTASFIALILLIIPFLIIGIAIKIDSKGPVFFKNRRIGRDGKVFNCLKFRSMKTTAPAEMATSIFSDSQSYITRFGRFLRKTSIDELPQLINVLLGQMSIIGYRPLVPTEKNCNDMRDKLCVFSMRPGISGFAQVHGRDDVYYKNKAIMDAYYVQNAGIAMDMKLLWGSVVVALTGKGNEGTRE